jgi:alkylation response protein AidB-like acyl-CoA dehydrogenase
MKDDTGLRIAGEWHGLGMRGNMSAPMNLNNVRLSPDRALTTQGKGLATMLGVVLPVFNLGNAAISLGIAEAAVQTTQKHLTTNKVQYINQVLAEIPLERARLAQIRTETDKGRAHLAAALDAVESPGPATMLLVLESKAVASETALQVTDIALRACGGTGFTRSLGLERNFRDARAASVMGSTTDVIYDFIGKALCGMELF